MSLSSLLCREEGEAGATVLAFFNEKEKVRVHRLVDNGERGSRPMRREKWD